MQQLWNEVKVDIIKDVQKGSLDDQNDLYTKKNRDLINR